MSVLKRGNSKNWYIQFQFRSKTYIRSSRTTDKRLAEQMEREWRRQLHAHEYLGNRERILITDILNQFIESKKGTPNHRNLDVHRKILQRLFETNRFLDEITSKDLERLKRDREREQAGPATIKHTFNLIRGMWKYGKKMGYQVGDLEYPVVKLPKHRLRYLSVDEEKRLLAELDPKRTGRGLKPFSEQSDDMQQSLIDVYDLVVILLDTGARHSEIANIEWRNINLDEKTIRLWRPKVQNESVLYMTDRVYRILRRRHQSRAGAYLFTNKKGGARGYASQSIRKAMKRAGLNDCTIHTLRHTHATRLIQNGMSVYEVKEILGHSDIKTTMRYAHLEQRDVSSRARDVINKINTRIEKPGLTVVQK